MMTRKRKKQCIAKTYKKKRCKFKARFPIRNPKYCGIHQKKSVVSQTGGQSTRQLVSRAIRTAFSGIKIAASSVGVIGSGGLGGDTIAEIVILLLQIGVLSIDLTVTMASSPWSKKFLDGIDFKQGPEGLEQHSKQIFSELAQQPNAQILLQQVCDSFSSILGSLSAAFGTVIGAFIPNDFGVTSVVVEEAIFQAGARAYPIAKKFYGLVPEIGKQLLQQPKKLELFLNSMIDLLTKTGDSWWDRLKSGGLRSGIIGAAALPFALVPAVNLIVIPAAGAAIAGNLMYSSGIGDETIINIIKTQMKPRIPALVKAIQLILPVTFTVLHVLDRCPEQRTKQIALSQQAVQQATQQALLTTPQYGGNYTKLKKIDFEDRFEYISSLGEGQFGAVHKMKDLQNDRIVAVKLLDGKNINKSAFLNEVNNWAKISLSPNCNPSITCLLDCGYTNFNNNIIYIIVMSYLVDSQTLTSFANEMIGRYREIPVKYMKQIMKQSIEALKYMHRRNVYHRDIKLDNILIRLEDNDQITLKFIDFGLACSLTPQNKLSKDCLRIVGTPDTLSPEFAKAIIEQKPVKISPKSLKAADIYALGVVFYMLNDDHPHRKYGLFETETREDVFEMVAYDPPEKLSYTLDSSISNDISSLTVLNINKRVHNFENLYNKVRKWKL